MRLSTLENMLNVHSAYFRAFEKRFSNASPSQHLNSREQSSQHFSKLDVVLERVRLLAGDVHGTAWSPSGVVPPVAAAPVCDVQYLSVARVNDTGRGVCAVRLWLARQRVQSRLFP